MRTVSQTLNQLNIYHRESGKEVAKKSPPKVGTDLKDYLYKEMTVNGIRLWGNLCLRAVMKSIATSV